MLVTPCEKLVKTIPADLRAIRSVKSWANSREPAVLSPARRCGGRRWQALVPQDSPNPTHSARTLS